MPSITSLGRPMVLSCTLTVFYCSGDKAGCRCVDGELHGGSR